MKELSIYKIRLGAMAGFYAIGFGVVGLVIGILYAQAVNVNLAVETETVLKGLAFGVSAGWVQVLFVTGVYALLGAVVGFLQALVFNLINRKADGIVVTTK